nr:hypothetical protein [Chloroflexota bacterium]
MGLRGILLCSQGMLFVLLPGYVLLFILRRMPTVDRTLIWWGAGGLLLALLPINFFTSLARQFLAASGGTARTVTQLIIMALLAGFFVEAMKYLVLKYKRVSGQVLVPSGIALGLGVGLITRIFLGFAFIGVGLRLLFGDTSTALLAETAARSLPDLGLAAIASLADRLSLLLFNACLGAVVGYALLEKKLHLLFYAMLIHAGIELGYNAITVGFAGWGQLPTLLTLAFEGALIAVGWWWLRGQLPAPIRAGKRKKRTNKPRIEQQD